MELITYIIVLLCIFVLWKLLKTFYLRNSIKNPFEMDSRKALKAQVTDHKQRDSVLKQSKSYSKQILSWYKI